MAEILLEMVAIAHDNGRLEFRVERRGRTPEEAASLLELAAEHMAPHLSRAEEVQAWGAARRRD